MMVGVVTHGEEADARAGSPRGDRLRAVRPVLLRDRGLRLDLDALLSSTTALILLPVFLGCFVLVRGVPALLARSAIEPAAIVPLALCSATALPLVVAVTAIAVEEHEPHPALAASLGA